MKKLIASMVVSVAFASTAFADGHSIDEFVSDFLVVKTRRTA